MALDALFLQAVTEELRREIEGLRIEKVQQPARDQIILVLRGNRKLLLCAGANAPRIQLTALNRDNPAAPPMFCMLLRKHLTGGRITALDQPPLERLVKITIDTSDELGRSGEKTLILEAMGRRSNLILLDGEGRIVECLRRVDGEMSASRQILPGLFYLPPPPPPDKLPATAETEAGFRDKLREEEADRRADQFLLARYFGLSPLLAREIVFRAAGDTDARLFQLDSAGEDRLWGEFRALLDAAAEHRFTPALLTREGSPVEFSCVPILQYGPGTEAETCLDFSALLDYYYEERDRQERSRVRGAELIRAATTARDRLARKLSAQERDYQATQNRDELRIRGDLITANLYRMERGQSRLLCDNFYGAEGETAEVPLDPLLTPQQNAAKYYKKYAKAKTAERVLREQMDLTRRDLTYLESVLEELSRAETEAEFLEIRRELRESGFLRVSGREKREMKRTFRPREYRTTNGFRVLAGRNNRQNDELTRGADHRDLWFHTQKIHGAHVILRTEGREPGEADIAQAAAIAAYCSQAREGRNVPVDYTPVRYVKKPAGARPGMVIYTTYHTMYVTPKAPEETGKR